MKIWVLFIERELKEAEKGTDRGTMADDGKQTTAQEEDSLPMKQGPYFQQLKKNKRQSLSINLKVKSFMFF